MPPTFRYLRSSLAALGLAAAAPFAVAQAPKPPAGVEVLARGAVHEAFATTNEFPEAGPVVPKQPPAPVEELPPDEKPAGDNVQWVPGYWSWDDDRKDFIWISGFWRVPPPGRVWVPGSWREAPGGSQWVPGFWQAPEPQAIPGQPAARADLDYLPPPPQPLEQNPSVPAPNDDSIYVPGSWVYRERYVWRPGYWIDYRPNWIWVPAHYRWTPVGYVFVDGYWDYPLANRGVLYAPVAFAPTVIAQPTFVYTPTYCVPAPTLYTAMFVRQRHCGYFFGDYFEAQYGRGGYRPWCGNTGASGFALSVGFGRGGFYDSNWFQFSVGYRSQPAVLSTFGDVYGGRFRGDLPRPPRTFVQQNTVVNNTTVVNNITNITNVTNNTTNVVKSVAASPLVATPAALQRATPGVNFQPVAQADRVREQQFARETQNLAAQRQKQEIALAARNPNPARPQPLGSPNAVGRPEVQPQRVKLDVPERVAARAQMPTAADKAPPPAPKPQSDRRGPDGNPRQNPGNAQPRPGDVQPTAPKPTPTPAPNTNPAPQPRPGDVKPTPTPAPNTNPANPTPRPRPGDVQPTPPKPMPTPRPGDVQPTAPKPTPTPAPNTNPVPQPRTSDPTPAPRPRPGDTQPVAPKPTPTPAPNTNPRPRPRPGDVQPTAPRPTPVPAPNTNPAPQPRPGNVQPPAPKPTPTPVPTPPPAPKPPPVPTPPAPRVPTPPPAPKPPPVTQPPAPKPQPVPTPPTPPKPQPPPQPPQQRNVPPAPKPQPKPQPAPAPAPMVRAQPPAPAPMVRAQAPQAPRPQPVAAPVVRPAPRPAATPPAVRAPVPARPQPPAARPAPAPIPAGKVPPKQNRPQR